jgi:hypothetical protein
MILDAAGHTDRLTMGCHSWGFSMLLRFLRLKARSVGIWDNRILARF